MDDEFDRICEYFNLPAEEKVEKLKEVFDYSIEFFNRLRHVLKEGTPVEQQEILLKAQKLQSKINAEMEKVCEETGMSLEDLERQAMNPELYSDDEWHIIESSRKEIDQQAHEIASMVEVTGEPGPSLSKDPKKKKKKRAGPWLKS